MTLNMVCFMSSSSSSCSSSFPFQSNEFGSSSISNRLAQVHTVAIWTFPFHKISGFVRVILKGNFKQLYRPKVSTFLSENSDLLFSFSFYFLQNLSNPLLFRIVSNLPSKSPLQSLIFCEM